MSLSAAHQSGFNRPKSFNSEGEALAGPPAFIRKVKQHIRANFSNQQFDVASLARKTHLSVSQLNHKKKTLTGEPPMSRIRKARLYRAEELLLNTNLFIAETTYDFGLTDPKYFPRAFGKEFEHSPRDIRNWYLLEDIFFVGMWFWSWYLGVLSRSVTSRQTTPAGYYYQISLL